MATWMQECVLQPPWGGGRGESVSQVENPINCTSDVPGTDAWFYLSEGYNNNYYFGGTVSQLPHTSYCLLFPQQPRRYIVNICCCSSPVLSVFSWSQYPYFP